MHKEGVFLNKEQIKILSKFITSNELRYSEAKPENLDNDSYKYHLKHLIEKGYIKKTFERYALTEQGKLFGHRIDPLGNVQDYFPVAIMCVIKVKDKNINKILVQRRLKHPSFGEMTVVCGKIKPGEKIVDCARRKLKEETGLVANFTKIGLLRAIRINKDSKVLNDQWFNVCYTTKVEGSLIENNKYWLNYYISEKELKKLSEENIAIKNVRTILNKIKNNNTPFIIEDIEILETY